MALSLSKKLRARIKVSDHQTVRQVSRRKFLITGPRADSMPRIVDFKHRVVFDVDREGNRIGRQYIVGNP